MGGPALFDVASESLGRFATALRAEVWLPTLVLLAGAFGMLTLAEPDLVAGRAAEKDRVDSVWHAMMRAEPAHVITGIALLILASVLFQPYSLAFAERLTRKPSGRIAEPVSQPFLRWHRWRRRSLRAAAMGPSDAASAGGAVDRASARAAVLARRYPQQWEDVRPTLLGNALLAAEEDAGKHYRFSWPRLGALLIAVLSERGHDPTASARSQIEVFTGLTTAFGGVALFGAVVFADEPNGWPLVVLAPVVAGFAVYRGAVRAAVSYGLSLELAVELHRFELLDALHLPLPANVDEERKTFSQLSKEGGRLEVAVYRHPGVDDGHDSIAARTPG